MAFKINISDKGKTFKLEADTEYLHGKKIGDKIDGAEINADLAGYELEIKGTSDKAGFPGKKDVDGITLKRVLLTRGFGMHNTKKGLRLRKTVRGNTISQNVVQINTIVAKAGDKKLEDIFKKEEAPTEGEVQSVEKPAEEKKEEAPKEQPKQETPKEKPEEKKE